MKVQAALLVLVAVSAVLAFPKGSEIHQAIRAVSGANSLLDRYVKKDVGNLPPLVTELMSRGCEKPIKSQELAEAITKLLRTSSPGIFEAMVPAGGNAAMFDQLNQMAPQQMQQAIQMGACILGNIRTMDEFREILAMALPEEQLRIFELQYPMIKTVGPMMMEMLKVQVAQYENMISGMKAYISLFDITQEMGLFDLQ